MSEAIYLYGFVSEETPTPQALEGIAGGAVEVLDVGGVGAVVGRVPAEEFAPEVLDARLEDLDWVAAHGVRHERVVTWFVDEASILPARLFTLYTSEEALLERVRARRSEIAERLRDLAGRREWDLKVSFDAEALRPHLARHSEKVAAFEEEVAGASPGRRYLLERKKDELLREEGGRVARRLADELLEEVGALADRVRELDLPAKAGTAPVVLSAALLVRAEREDRLRDELDARSEALDACGLRVRFSGPWAPYRFLDGWEGVGDGSDTDAPAD